MKNIKGQTLVAVMIFLGIVFLFTITLIANVLNNRIVTQISYETVQSLNIAEAGIDKAIWCLNNTSACADPYTGETTQIGAGEFTSVLTDIGGDYLILSTGTVNDTQKTIKATISKHATSASASFFYGVQVGAGGLVMGNNSFIDGNVYSNGTITASPGAYASGDVYVAGGTALVADQEQTTITSDFIVRQTNSNRDIAQSFKPGTETTEVINYVSFYLKKVGNPGNATVHITEDNSGEPATSSIADGTLNASQVTTEYGWIDVSFTSNPELTPGTTYWIIFDNNSDHNSRYFLIGKHDNLGYGNGVGLYSEDWTGNSWNDADGDFTFKTWMGGLETKIDGLTIGDAGHTCDDAHYDTHHGDAHANQILNSTVECDAYYDEDPADISGSTVGRNKIADSADPPPEVLPISDAKITEWKNEAEAGGTHNGDYVLDVDGAVDSIGPLKITGNLTVKNRATLTISGNIWVVGDILFDTLCNIQLDPGYTSASGLIVNDGKIQVRNNCTFNGSGSPGSFILVLTTNNSQDTNSPAIDIDNNADTVIFYAGKGLIKVKNGATLKEATGYKLELSPIASVTYVSGLANAKFTNGPGGIWTTESTSWQQID